MRPFSFTTFNEPLNLSITVHCPVRPVCSVLPSEVTRVRQLSDPYSYTFDECLFASTHWRRVIRRSAIQAVLALFDVFRFFGSLPGGFLMDTGFPDGFVLGGPVGTGSWFAKSRITSPAVVQDVCLADCALEELGTKSAVQTVDLQYLPVWFAWVGLPDNFA